MTLLVPKDVDKLAGLEMGGIPLVTVLSSLTGIPALFVRKKAKPYGTAKLAEGGTVTGRTIVVIEDVVTGTSFLATAYEKIVSVILGGHDGRRGYIHHLAVDADWRRLGIGRQLVESCLGALKASGIRKTHVFVFADNPSGITFWESVGWTFRTDLRVVSKAT